MSTRWILLKSTFWLGMVELVSKIIMFGVTVSIVRYFGPAKFGTYNLAFSYVAIFMIFSDFGLSTVTTREVAKSPELTEKYISNILGLKLFLSAVIAFMVFISIWLIPTSGVKTLILAAMLYNLIQNLGSVFTSIFSALEKMELVFVSKISYYLGILIAALGVITNKGSAMDLVLAYTVMTSISSAFAAILVNRLGYTIKFEYDKEFWTKLLKETVPFLGLAIVGTLYANNDTLLIGKYFGNYETGLYQSAYKIYFAFQSINVVNNAIFPRISVLLHEQKIDLLIKILKIVVGLSLLGLLPLCWLITIYQNQIVRMVYGEVYLTAAPVMVLMVWTGVINYFRIMTSNILFAQGKQTSVFYAVGIGLLINISINLLIMPRYGFVVAGWSMLVSEAVILLITVLNLVIRSSGDTSGRLV